MFRLCCNASHQFSKKFQPLLCLLDRKTFTTLKIAHHRKPSEQFHQKMKKSKKHSVKAQSLPPKTYMRDLINKIYNILRYSTWDSAEEQLENLDIKWDSYTVNQVLKTHPPMEKAWLFFNWASGKRNFKHDQYTYTTMLDIFGEANRISSMKYVFGQMQEKGIKIDVVTYTSLLHWMSSDGDVDGAVELWEEMKAKGCRPTVVSYTAYMKVLFDHKRVKEATDVYKDLLRSGLSPNCYTYTVLMEHLAYSGKFEEALGMFNKMQEAGVEPDKAACNILVEICCQKGETWTMMKILQYMKENFLVLRYPVYLKALETFKTTGEDDMLLRQANQHCSAEHSCMDKTDKLDPTLDSNSLTEDDGIVLNLLNKKNLLALDYLLADMFNKGIQLESVIVSSIIEVNSAQGRQNGALLAFDYSLKMGLNIDRTSYLALIGLSIRANSFQKVVEIVKEMVKLGHSLGTHLSSLLIYRLGCNGESTSAATIFSLLPDKKKSTAAYSALIGAYFSSNNPDMGLETFELMKRQGVTVALGTYSALVTGLEKCGRVSELESYRKEMKRMQAEVCSRAVSVEESICNLLFARDFLFGHNR